jgi:hypothetical protein
VNIAIYVLDRPEEKSNLFESVGEESGGLKCSPDMEKDRPSDREIVTTNWSITEVRHDN